MNQKMPTVLSAPKRKYKVRWEGNKEPSTHEGRAWGGPPEEVMFLLRQKIRLRGEHSE